MRELTVALTACRYCQHYTPEGRRGGYCGQLGVSVQGSWKPCPFMIPAFTSSWSPLPSLMVYPQPIAESLPLAKLRQDAIPTEAILDCEV
jgi:hypothetical protein